MLRKIALCVILVCTLVGTAQATTQFQDNVEGGVGGWTATGLWHRETSVDPCPNAHSGTASWYYGNDAACNFDTGTNSGTLTSQNIVLPATGNTQLSFWYYYETEETGTTYDRRYVQVAVDGGGFTNLTQLSGDTMNAWHQQVLDLSAYAGHTIQLRFFFDTVDPIANNYKGWYIDDVLVYNTATPYVLNPVSYLWQDISATGTDTGIACDDCGAVVPIGFNFNFFGNVYSTIGISSNGYLSFGSNISTFSNFSIPSTSSPNNMIAPLWDDLYVFGAKGHIYTQTLGTAPNRTFVVEYANVDFFPTNGSGNLYFEVIISEASGAITFQYQDMLSVNAGRGGGNSATIGIDNNGGTDGLQYSYDTVSVTDGLAIQFSPTGFLDSDGDGLPDFWEILYGTNPNNPNDPVITDDVDGDGLNWLQEYQAGTNPLLADTDFDGVSDGAEVDSGTNPLVNNGPSTVASFAGPGVEFGTAYFTFNTPGGVGDATGFRVYYGAESGTTISDYPAFLDINNTDHRSGIIDRIFNKQVQVFFRVAPFKIIGGRKYVGTPSNELSTYFARADKTGASAGAVVTTTGGGAISGTEVMALLGLTVLFGGLRLRRK